MMRTLDGMLPRHVASKSGEVGRQKVMNCLKNMLVAAALRRDGEMHALPVA
jgi:hypothetical protein